MFSMLRALEKDVRCRLRSAVAVTSVAQCVEELVLNSVDAGASCIAVRVDLETFKVQVVDNGCGLCREDMERVGRRYFTSKCHSVEDLEELRFYGFRGEAIASMVDTSSVVEIYSKHRDSQQTFSRLFQNGKPLEVLEVESTRPSAGTTVTIYNLFFSLPVRRRCLDPAMELERIRHRVEAVSLLRPCVSFSLRNDAVHSMLLQLPKTKDLCSRFCQIYGLSRSRGLREAQHTHGTFTMQGLISREGHYNRTMQFLYVNQRLVLKTSLHKLMDSIIRKESSICRASSRPRSATDLYGIFIVNIQCPASGYDICFQPDKTLIQFQDWDAVMSCTERGLKIFLKRENLLLEPSKEAMAASGQNHRSNSSCGEGEWSSPPKDPWKLHHSDSAHLRSKCVNRNSDVTEAGAQEDHQLPSKVSQTLMVTQEGRKECDSHEVVVNHDGSPLPPLHTCTIHKTVFTTALSCAMSETTSSVPHTPPNPSCTSTGSDATALSWVPSEKINSFVPQHPTNRRCSSTGSASTALSCATSEKTTSFVLQNPPNPRCSSTESASTALSCAMSENTALSVPPNPRYSSSVSTSTALSFATSEKTTLCVPQNPLNRCPGTEYASTTLSCVMGEKTTSSVPQNPPNLRCPWTGSASTTLSCVTSEKTTSSVPPNPRCSSTGSASTALSCVTSEKTTSCVPQNPHNLRCLRTGTASTALSCAPSEKTISSVPPNPRCPGTGSVSTALYCATSETTISSVPTNPRCSSIGSASTALSCVTSEKTTSCVPQNPPNLRCPGTESASTTLSCAPSEKTTSTVPPNPRCPGTGSVSTALNCARSETTDSSIPPNPRCSSIGSASTALSCATSEKTTSSVPPNPRCSSAGSASTDLSCVTSEKTNSSVPHTATYPRCPGTESKPLQKDISKFAVSTPISAPYPLPKERQKGRATKRAKNINQRHSSEPTNIQLSVASSLGGTLDKFRRRYGKNCPADKDHQEQQPPISPGKSEAIKLISCVGTDIPPCSVRTTPPGPLDYVGIKQRESPHPQCSPTLTTKLCRLKNQSETWWGMGKPALSAPHGSVICGNGANPMSCEQQSAQSHGGQSADDSLDGPMSHEWLHCYQESLGKSVFINTMTGLSSYSAPTMDTPAACTKDFSNMAVNVVCSGGFQYPSHPFKSRALLPFLPRPRHERDTAGQTEDGALSSLYTEWTNPVYERHPALAVDVSREHSDVLSVKIHNILCPYRFTKEMVHSMKVLQQVDSKFIACVMEAGLTTASGGQLLVLVDQHAAHERVRLEQLIADSFQGSSEFCERRLKVSVVDPALEIHVSEEEYRILRTRAGSLGRLGLSLSFPDTGSPRILVSEIPLCFLEREANETQRGRRPVLRSIVEEYLQEQVQLLQVTGAGNLAVPGTVLRVLASQACHGAVKFNHPLTVAECCQLMRSLAQCALPFQCAHGRPSILPLADLQHVAPEPEVSPSPNLRRLRQRLLRWQLTK